MLEVLMMVAACGAATAGCFAIRVPSERCVLNYLLGLST
jgi:hypothetical protein